MQVPAVGTADEVGEGDRSAIGKDLERKSYRAERSGLATGSLAHTLGARHSEGRQDAGKLLRLDGIQLVIATHDERDHFACRAVDEQGLYAAVGRDA